MFRPHSELARRRPKALGLGLGLLLSSNIALAQTTWTSTSAPAMTARAPARVALQELGVQITAELLLDALGSVTRPRGIRFSGDLYLALELDFARLAGIPGLKGFLSTSWAFGQDISTELVRNTLTAAQSFNGRTFRLYEIALEQALFDGVLNILVGRIGLGDELLTSELYTRFVSAAFNGNPAGITVNIPGFSVYPMAAWGARLRYKPNERFYAALGVYSSDSMLADPARHGVDWSFGEGALTVLEVGLQHPLWGDYKLGGYFDSGRFPDLQSSGAPKQGNYGFYVMFERAYFNERLSSFASIQWAPPKDRNPIELFATLGLSAKGLFGGRGKDLTSLGWAFATLRDQNGSIGYEMVLELTHRFVLWDWLFAQPDLQLIQRPDRSFALLLGAEMTVRF